MVDVAAVGDTDINPKKKQLGIMYYRNSATFPTNGTIKTKN